MLLSFFFCLGVGGGDPDPNNTDYLYCRRVANIRKKEGKFSYLGKLGQVDDHEEVPEVWVEHLLELHSVHLGYRLDQVPQLPTHRGVRRLTSGNHRLHIPVYRGYRQCCETVTIFYGSGSDFWEVPVPVPIYKFRFRLLTSSGSSSDFWEVPVTTYFTLWFRFRLSI